MLRIESPGPLCTAQDLGRHGFQRFGVSTSGAMDQHALALGNVLLGNERDAAGLEVTFGGFEATFSLAAQIAITGGDLGLKLNDGPASMWEVIAVDAGDRISLPAALNGLRAYLCIAGGFDVPLTLGSAATYLNASLGGVDGRALQTGDELRANMPVSTLPEGTRIPGGLIPDYSGEMIVRALAGPQENQFTTAGLATFYERSYVVSDRSDRQGIRLEGPEIEAGSAGYDIVSDAVVTGAIQVPGDKKPIGLMADRQTTGGYPKIAVAATVDLGLLAQAAPGTSVRFARITVDEAHEYLRQREHWFENPVFERPVSRKYSLSVNGTFYEVSISGHVPQPDTSADDPQQKDFRTSVEVNGQNFRVEVQTEE